MRVNKQIIKEIKPFYYLNKITKIKKRILKYE